MNIFGKPEPLAAIHAAEAYGTSTKEQFYRSTTIFAFQISIFHSLKTIVSDLHFF
jgi:hypothetical protein